MSDQTPKIKIVGRIFVNFEIHALTGLHIGGAAGTLAIGNVDNPVIRNPFNSEPYVPGSSLRGKMRSQLEKLYGLAQNTSIGRDVSIHSAKTQAEYDNSPVLHIFGIPASDFLTEPIRLIVRDAALSEQTRAAFRDARTDLPYTEVKWEAAIDRVTSAATPRQQERVPAGAIFDGALTFTLYNDQDTKLFNTVIRGLELVEEDYLGGQGARGSGQVAFKNIMIRFQQHEKPVLEKGEIGSLAELRALWAAQGYAAK
ncbi:MAG TPA: type III-A CRISPR-associated RAMP protein Csm3 [Herpetosiphon sp.]|uniref:CRISPR system Cms endoribonuclease Csm3 n=1 Tax=Herpetosiphon aurantiacus (strain ATCC 23779 / DSM 785 / 114-95) TaxID=316274 RepID=A9AZH1_HERA2|nr:type III-A CRISPR-associated RAMP protein Csm3 [Herpetosiphon sp.]ABX05115.1 CRISPR-associated RAMP protein, Csm3 family [Herpetosiphon aurantiacus DSM 785]HBW49096.1 type III-A CRISPR-associated RAMP protein Csm3 [Herpetosiphon sp.]